MLELRILSGLHRGATLPLDSRTHIIGASEDADVVLVDPEIEQQHATLKLTAAGWELTALEGRILSSESNEGQSTLHLAAGDFARVGAVWVTVTDQDAGWQNPPPEPVDAPPVTAAAAQVELPEARESQEPPMMTAETPADESNTSMQPPVLAEETPDESDVPEASVSGTRANRSAPAWKAKLARVRQHAREKLKGRRMVHAMLAVGVVLSGATAYTLTAGPDMFKFSAQKDAPPAADSPAAASAASASAKPGRSGKPADKTVAKAFDALHNDSVAGRALTGEELRSAFRKRLADADLLKRFDLTLQENQWFMQAALDDEEAARFERILAVFLKTHNITFPVQAKVGGAESMLPFKIRQVVSGMNASVLTDDGQQLFIGDEHRGVRLVAIKGNRISFGGKRKIEVRW